MNDLTQRLVDFALSTDEPDAEALNVMRLSLLDWLAVGCAGVDEPVSKIMLQLAMDEGGGAQAKLFGGTMAPMRMAALVNGTISHALDYDDTHFDHIGHASVGVIPAALAVAQNTDATGAEFLQACLIGVEGAVRFGTYLGRSHYQVGFHQTATAGAFGACLAAARLMKLTADQTGYALGIAATKAAGLKVQFGTMGKPYNAGLAASAGVEAAQLASLGFVSNPDALNAPLGFSETHHGDGNLAAFDDMGTNWRFIDVQHKFHACCHGLHATLEALATLDPQPDPKTIAEIRILTHPRWMSVCNQPAPTTGLGAKFSYATVTAMALLGHNTAKLNSYADAICTETAVVALRDKVSVMADDRGDAGLTEMEALVLIRHNDGSEVEGYFNLNSPMAFEDRRTRVINKSAALIGSVNAGRAWRLIANPDGFTLARFVALLG